jgi:hypothetical protein
MCGQDQSNPDKQALTDYHLSRSIPLAEYSVLRFVMAALESTRFVQFALPPSNPLFCNSNTLWPSKPGRSIRSVNASGSQKIHRPAATRSRGRYQIETDKNTAARAKSN